MTAAIVGFAVAARSAASRSGAPKAGDGALRASRLSARAGVARSHIARSVMPEEAVTLASMPVLIYGDTLRSCALRHEVPLSIPDPFLYLESNGTRAVTASAIERPRLEQSGGLEVIGVEELGWDELITSGRPRWDIELEVAARAVERLGLTAADVPAEFPLELANRLRERGI